LLVMKTLVHGHIICLYVEVLRLYDTL